MVSRHTATIFGLIETERKRQIELWGEQNHSPEKWMAILAEEVGEVAKEINDGPDPFDLLGSRRDWEKRLVTELVQVAAVAVAAIEDLGV